MKLYTDSVRRVLTLCKVIKFFENKSKGVDTKINRYFLRFAYSVKLIKRNITINECSMDFSIRSKLQICLVFPLLSVTV